MGKRGKSYGRVDWFRLPAALLVIAIHTAPFASVCPVLDTVVTYGLGRMAVPFFLMTTGYFVLGHGEKDGSVSRERLGRFLKKTLALYGASILLYLPVMWYAGKLPSGFSELLKMLVFDGTFYHLWYFPAMILGSLILTGLLDICSMRTTAVITGLLYLIGLLGDSYYGLVEGIPAVGIFYEGLFSVSSYTRNGIFYAPIFLYLGAALRRSGRDRRQRTGPGARTAFLICLSAMLAESVLTDRFGLQRHNSMYLMLPMVMVLFYPFLLQGDHGAPVFLRNGTAFLYVIHPISILLVREPPACWEWRRCWWSIH